MTKIAFWKTLSSSRVENALGWRRVNLEAGDSLGLDSVCDTMPSRRWARKVSLLKEVLRSKLLFISELSEQGVVADKVIFRTFLK